jgi:hypothetical protein
MQTLNKTQLNEIKAKFTQIANFGLNNIVVFNNQIQWTTEYEIPAQCGYDEELNDMQDFIKQNYM